MDNNNDLSKEELLNYNRKLKKAVLDAMFRVSDTFYVHCMPDPQLYLGRRGLMDQEKKDGIILVFGPYATRSLDWDEEFIHCEMQFTQTWENVSIPFECIFRIFDKNGQVLMQWNTFSSDEIVQTDLTDVTSGKTVSSRGHRHSSAHAMEPEDGGVVHTGQEAHQNEPKKGEVIEVDFAARKKQQHEQTDDSGAKPEEGSRSRKKSTAKSEKKTTSRKNQDQKDSTDDQTDAGEDPDDPEGPA